MKSQMRFALLNTIAFILLSSLSPNSVWPQAAQLHPNSTGESKSANWPATKESKHLRVRVNPDADMSLYNTIAVGTVAYTGSANKLNAQEAAKLESLFRDSLSRDLATVKLNAAPSATRTMTANINVTNVKRTHPWINVVTIAAVFVPLDFGQANATAEIVDQQTGEVIAELEAEGCGQIYEVIPSLQPLGQSRRALKKAARSIAQEVGRITSNRPNTPATAVVNIPAQTGTGR
jgi:hypothetical protein